MTISAGVAVVCAVAGLAGCSSDSGAKSSGGAGASVGGAATAGASNGGATTAGQGGSPGGAGGSAGSSAGAAGSSGNAGSSAGAGAAGSSGSAGSGGVAGAAATGQAFLPNATYTYVGKGPNAGLSIVAGSISQSGTAPTQILLAVKSIGPDPVCIITIPADLLDASDVVLKHVEVIVNAPMYTTFNSAEPCLGAGDTGYGMATVGVDTFDVSTVAKVNYGVSGNIDPAATKLSDVTVDGVTVSDFSASMKTMMGTLTNHSATQAYKYPEVDVYTLDPAGRPLAQGLQLDAGGLDAGASWPFMLYITSPVDQYVALPRYETP
jgi:hypothetical protein